MSPQHPQQQDRYHETLLDARLRGLTPYAWGIIDFELDERALEAGTVALTRLSAVLPSGAVLRCSQEDSDVPAARPIEGHFPAHRESLDVYLGVPLVRSGGAAYARQAEPRGRSRYVIESTSVLDEVAPDDELDVEFARHNLGVWFGDEAREDLECIKLAEVVRDSNGKLVMEGPYIPPSLRVGASPALQDGIKRVLAASVARWRAVAEERRHRDSSSAEYEAEDVTRFLALAALGTAIPLLKQIAETGDASPYQAYCALAQLAGQLSSFAIGEDPTTLPTYQHLDPRQTFEPLVAKLLTLLRVAVASRVIVVPLEGRADGTHLGRLIDQALVLQGTRFVASIQASLPAHQVNELVPRIGKVASWQDIPRLVASATGGVPLVATPRPPREIPIRTGRFYFSVQTEHPLWQGVLAQRAIAFHLPPPFDARTTSVELLAIPPE